MNHGICDYCLQVNEKLILEESYLLGCDGVQSGRSLATFGRNTLPLPLVPKSNPRNRLERRKYQKLKTDRARSSETSVNFYQTTQKTVGLLFSVTAIRESQIKQKKSCFFVGWD
jgi:hypothetical protein